VVVVRTGECATLWPPVLLPSGVTTATGAAGVTGLGIASMNGGMQVTEGGAPLYRYSGDSAAGDTNGDGLSSFGGVWHVAGTTRPASGGAATTTTPTTMGGYGSYGGYGG
jgi:predicted lipoprotein with Yx(FWY)xxD motif